MPLRLLPVLAAAVVAGLALARLARGGNRETIVRVLPPTGPRSGREASGGRPEPEPASAAPPEPWPLDEELPPWNGPSEADAGFGASPGTRVRFESPERASEPPTAGQPVARNVDRKALRDGGAWVFYGLLLLLFMGVGGRRSGLTTIAALVLVGIGLLRMAKRRKSIRS